MANKHRKVWKVVSRKPLFGKQTQLKGKTLSWKPNQIFLWLESVFRWPESVFRWSIFLMTNKHRKVWKVVSRKVNSGKQTWPRFIKRPCQLDFKSGHFRLGLFYLNQVQLFRLCPKPYLRWASDAYENKKNTETAKKSCGHLSILFSVGV